MNMKSDTDLKSGICVTVGETDSYIYLSGIKPDRVVALDNNVILMPISCSPVPDDMIDAVMKHGNRSEFELGVLIATLRLTSAQIKVQEDNARSLVISTWNAQTTCILLAALLNCEIAWYCQANDSADHFSAQTRISFVYPNMYKFPATTKIIDDKTCLWIEKSLSSALTLSEDERFLNAANALWSYRWNPRPSVQLSVIWGGIESLFLLERKIKQNLSMAASRFLKGNDDMVGDIKHLYNARCKAVHEAKNNTNEALLASSELLHNLILQCVKLNSLPDWKELLNTKD